MKALVAVLMLLLVGCASDPPEVLSSWKQYTDELCACETYQCFHHARRHHVSRMVMVRASRQTYEAPTMLEHHGEGFRETHDAFTKCMEPVLSFERRQIRAFRAEAAAKESQPPKKAP